jgi:hypothetical protein
VGYGSGSRAGGRRPRGRAGRTGRTGRAGRAGLGAAAGAGVLVALLTAAWGRLVAPPGLVEAGPVEASTEAGPRRAPALWLCDRDARRLVALDGEGFLVRELPVPSPVALLVGSDGAPVVLSAVHPSAGAPRRLLRLDREGRLLASAEVGEVAVDELARDDRGGVHLLRRGPGGAELWRWGTAGGLEFLGACPGARGLRARGGLVWVLFERRALPVQGGPWPAGPGELLDLAPGAEEAWELRRVGGRCLLRRMAGAGVRDRWLPESATRVVADGADGAGGAGGADAAGGGAGGAWCLAEDGRVWRVGPSGAVLSGGRIPQRPLRGALVASGALWWLSPGAVGRLDRRGVARPGQGGFDALVAGAGVARGAPAGAP